MATEPSGEEPPERAEASARRKAKDGGVEPAPGEANPLSEPKGRANDQRRSVWE